jgi:hypothetical protein
VLGERAGACLIQAKLARFRTSAKIKDHASTAERGKNSLTTDFSIQNYRDVFIACYLDLDFEKVANIACKLQPEAI